MALHKAVFLDRDGILIKERGDYSYKPEHIEMVDGVGEALKKIQDAGYKLIVVTNQGGVALGLYDHREVDEVHEKIDRHLKKYRVKIEEYYYCPHHHKVSKCLCRKPDSLLLEKAIARHKIRPSLSYFIGDNARDVEAGTKAGVHPILVTSNANLNDYLSQIEM